jgi:nucleoside-diphosphate-sugar epimerase
MTPSLVVGAGPIGSGIATLLAERGHDVRLVSRTGRGPDHPRIARVAADAADAARMAELAAGAAALYNAVNPAYHRWAADWPPIAASLLEAAAAAGAVLVTVSNVYGYGPVAGPMTEDLPLLATGAKGRVRATMFRDALAAHETGRVRITEVRASDYVGPGAQSHLGERVVPRLLAGRPVAVLGSPDQPHTWTYTGDVARLAVAVADDERAWGRAWHVPSNPPRTQREAIGDLTDVAGVPAVQVSPVPRAALAALGLINPTVRELREVRYQLERPFVLDSSAAQAVFGLAPTPWRAVLADTLRSFGWAPAAAPA